MAGRETTLDLWFARRHVLVLVAILLASVSIRIAHYHAFIESPAEPVNDFETPVGWIY